MNLDLCSETQWSDVCPSCICQPLCSFSVIINITLYFVIDSWSTSLYLDQGGDYLHLAHKCHNSSNYILKIGDIYYMQVMS